MAIPPYLEDRFRRLGVVPFDVVESFVRGSGPGGQKINKASSTVLLRHTPSGIEVRCQAERSQAANRAIAWEQLCRKLEERAARAEALALHERERKRRQTRQKSRSQKSRMIEQKKHRARTKLGRGRPGLD